MLFIVLFRILFDLCKKNRNNFITSNFTLSSLSLVNHFNSAIIIIHFAFYLNDSEILSINSNKSINGQITWLSRFLCHFFRVWYYNRRKKNESRKQISLIFIQAHPKKSRRKILKELYHFGCSSVIHTLLVTCETCEDFASYKKKIVAKKKRLRAEVKLKKYTIF